MNTCNLLEKTSIMNMHRHCTHAKATNKTDCFLAPPTVPAAKHSTLNAKDRDEAGETAVAEGCESKTSRNRAYGQPQLHAQGNSKCSQPPLIRILTIWIPCYPAKIHRTRIYTKCRCVHNVCISFNLFPQLPSKIG